MERAESGREVERADTQARDSAKLEELERHIMDRHRLMEVCERVCVYVCVCVCVRARARSREIIRRHCLVEVYL